MVRINKISPVKESKVFDDIKKFANNVNFSNPQSSKSVQADSVEISNKTTKEALKDKLIKNKKYIIGAGVVLAGIIGLALIKKNTSGINKAVEAVENEIEIPVKTLHEELYDTAKKFLIDDVEKIGQAGASGVCFYGPDSIGKEQTIERFLTDLKSAGYKIDRAPRYEKGKVDEISLNISKLIQKAEERFQETKQRTAILVRDLDKLAPDREVDAVNNATGALLRTEKCREKGYVWISEAVDMTKIDPAVKRAGRIDHTVITKPSVHDEISVWNEYIGMIKRLRESSKKDWLLEDAQESLKSLEGLS